MVMNRAKALSEHCQLLKGKIDDCFTRRNDPRRETLFARRGITRDILEEGRLEDLFKLLLQSGSSATAHGDSADLTRIAKKIRGTGSSVSYCNVLATLLYSRCRDETLREFVNDILHTKSGKLIADEDMPLAQEDAQEAFGNGDGHLFWMHQYVFCPVVLKENDESTYVNNKASCPMPFTEEPVKIGRGASAIVSKVTIEEGHLVNERENSLTTSVRTLEILAYFLTGSIAKGICAESIFRL